MDAWFLGDGRRWEIAIARVGGFLVEGGGMILDIHATTGLYLGRSNIPLMFPLSFHTV